MAGFDRDPKIEEMRQRYISLRTRLHEQVDELKRVYEQMRDMKFTLQEHPEFTQDHLDNLESAYDELKSELGSLLQAAPTDLPVGDTDLLE